MQTMTKHTMAEVQALHNFSYENGGLRVWRAYASVLERFIDL